MSSLKSDGANIALLIDADNSPAGEIDFIISELAKDGVVNIRRAYGNWKKETLSSWEKVLHEQAIQPVQHFDLIKGKNGSDIAMVIDAMDMLHTKELDAFCLVSSDCDFTPLILRLKADGKSVLGFGNQNTPKPFVDACTRFLYLGNKEMQAETPKITQADGNRLKGDTKLMNALRHAVRTAESDDGWSALGEVGHHLQNKGSFDSRNYGFNKLSELFKAIDLFEIKSGKKDRVTTYWVRSKA